MLALIPYLSINISSFSFVDGWLFMLAVYNVESRHTEPAHRRSTILFSSRLYSDLSRPIFTRQNITCGPKGNKKGFVSPTDTWTSWERIKHSFQKLVWLVLKCFLIKMAVRWRTIYYSEKKCFIRYSGGEREWKLAWNYCTFHNDVLPVLG